MDGLSTAFSYMLMNRVFDGGAIRSKIKTDYTCFYA